MSQNKTVIQGLEPNGRGSGNYGGGGYQDDFYSRGNSRGNGNSQRGTVVPGMNPRDATPHPSQNFDQFQQKKFVNTGKPVVGFLYSISRTPLGEFWPLHVGKNSIGNTPSSDIELNEGTVSADHAVVVVRQMKGTNKVIAAITDTQSTNGTMINGESIGFKAEECHNGDVITIGNNYDLLLILIDTGEIGLSVAENFVLTESDSSDKINPFEESDGPTPPPFMPGGAPTVNPYMQNNPNYGAGGGVPNNATVGLDGQQTGYNSGGTVSL